MKRATEETESLTVRLPVALLDLLRAQSKEENRALVLVVRQALETFWFYELPPKMREVLEEDEKAQKLSRQEYLQNLLLERYSSLAAAGPQNKKK